ncbi:hypothetical protein TOK_1836 [Pseudonocardia sp. N23]|nr:hypothetical protein TOK_1836 [Pseudonocardia sp. N23]
MGDRPLSTVARRGSTEFCEVPTGTRGCAADGLVRSGRRGGRCAGRVHRRR